MSRGDKWTEREELNAAFSTFDKAQGGCVIGDGIIDDSEAHIGVYGNTGYGKSSCVVIPHVISCAYKKEALLITDPKGEIRDITEGLLRKQGYKVIVIDFRNPSLSPDGINLLQAPYKMYKSGDPNLMDIASNEIDELVHNIYPENSHADPFWPMSAADLVTGLIYSLFDVAEKEERNMASVAKMIQQSEHRVRARETLINEYVSMLEEGIAKDHLDGYASAPNDTRGSIHSTAAQGMALFARSNGLIKMLSNDTIDVCSLDVETPLAIFIIVPDDSNTYDQLAGVIVSQLTHHFIRLAHEKYNGKLPRRLNVVIEELGSIGKAISSLPSLMVSSRSRNVRLMLVLQDRKQLVDIFGESKSATINACIGINYVFSSNNYHELGEWASRCGTRITEFEGQSISEPLITASQLAAMPVGTALIMIRNRYKYIEPLKFYNQIFSIPEMSCEERINSQINQNHKIFNLMNYVLEKRKALEDESINNSLASLLETHGVISNQEDYLKKDKSFLIDAIDKRIEQLEREHEAESNSPWTDNDEKE